jgi:RNA polymerase sigma-70 factor (ECF subfamily)
LDNTPKDSALINLRNNSREVFCELFKYYYPRLMAYVSSITDDNIAEDIVQDVFMYVWENRKKLLIKNGFHSYLYQAAYTRSIDYLRKSKTIEQYNLQAFNNYIELYRTLLNDNCKVIEDLYSKDFYERLQILLSNIPAERRVVFIMTYFKGMKAKEVSEILEIPQRTVESHVYLTIKYLRLHMSKNDFFLLLFSLTFM